MSIEKIERIENLVEPEWGKQEGESEKWYQRFFLYYLQQNGNRSVKKGLLTWARVNEKYDERKLEIDYKEWKLIAERNLWEEREAAYDRHNQKILSNQEYDLLKDFKQEGTKLAQNLMRNANKATAFANFMLEQYAIQLPRDAEGKVDFDNFDENKYSKIFSSLKSGADLGNSAVEVNAKLLALDEAVSMMIENNENEI